MSCLFDSLSKFLKNKDNLKPVSSYELRQEICDYIEDNNNILMDDLPTTEITNAISNKDLGDYIKSMRQNNTWGSALEIKAFCNIYNARIKVFNLNDKKTIEFLPLNNDFSYTIFLNYTGNHYIPNKII